MCKFQVFLSAGVFAKCLRNARGLYIILRLISSYMQSSFLFLGTYDMNEVCI